MVFRQMERFSTDIVDVLAFVRVVETGSFGRAAERMGLSKPALSRRVARLEQQLGARLLTRTARGAQPTDIGSAYHARAANILAELDAAREVVADAVTQVAGPIRLTGPINFGSRYLGPALADFARMHPKVELDVSLEDRTVDLTAGGYDLAIRIGRLKDSALVARKLAPIRGVVVASPAYLESRGRPQRPSDLSGHDLLFYANVVAGEQWRFRVGDRWEVVRGHIRFRADNGDLLRNAAVAGLGVVVVPSFIASDSIQSGELEVILRDFPVEEVGLYAVMPPGRATTARVRALVDFLAERFGPEPDWDPCWMASCATGP
jgi:DNA-binding transcriptional LysR family regulator